MYNLNVSSDMPFEAHLDGSLIFDRDTNPVNYDTRNALDMKNLWYQPDAAHDKEIYYMHRNICKIEDMDLFRSKEVRYDITMIMPGNVGCEFIKTAGHYHPEEGNSDIRYPEVYEVIHGIGHYLLQKFDPADMSITDVVLVKAEAGEKIIIPPGYGHVTINPGSEPLIMDNLVASCFSSVYDDYRNKHGAAYYEIQDHNITSFIPNLNYNIKTPLRRCSPEYFTEYGVVPEKTLYESFVQSPEKFEWLRHPVKYIDKMERIYN